MMTRKSYDYYSYDRVGKVPKNHPATAMSAGGPADYYYLRVNNHN